MHRDVWARPAKRYYSRIAANLKERVDAAVLEICVNPTNPVKHAHLKGQLHCKRRSRIGNLRLIYTINEDKVIT